MSLDEIELMRDGKFNRVNLNIESVKNLDPLSVVVVVVVVDGRALIL